MPFDQRGLDDYIDVPQRIAEFRERYPEGSLQPHHAPEIQRITGTAKDGKEVTATFIVYTAAAYRTQDDKRPGIGMAWEVFPGRTPYTLGSELMNAETSAWGRAIVAALASDSKRGVSSREEVRNRAAEHEEPRQRYAHTDAAHERLVPGQSTEDRANGKKAERIKGKAPDDEWTTKPATDKDWFSRISKDARTFTGDDTATILRRISEKVEAGGCAPEDAERVRMLVRARGRALAVERQEPAHA